MKNYKSLFLIFLIESAIFLTALFLGLLAIKKNQFLFKQGEILHQASRNFFYQFIIYFFLVTCFFLLTTYFLKSKRTKKIFFKLAFIFAVFFGSLILLLFFFSPILSLGLVVIFIFWWLKQPNVLNQNILMIFGITGASVVLAPIFPPKVFIFLLLFFSIYDIIAVYKTKHMVKIAKEMIEHQAILGVIVPKKIEGFKEKLEKVRPGGDFLVLGGGDFAFPLIFSLTLSSRGMGAPIIMAIFSLAGFFLNNLVLFCQKEKKPIPALPLISFSSLIGFIISSR